MTTGLGDSLSGLRGDETLELRQGLDQVAQEIIEQGDGDLVFGGSSEQEAEIFGAQINASDSFKPGAFLGGVALANIKVQQQRQQRLNRINKLQDRLQREAIEEARLSTDLTQTSIREAGANSRNAANNANRIQTATLSQEGQTSRAELSQSRQDSRLASTIAGQDRRSAADRKSREGIANTRDETKAQKEAEALAIAQIIEQEAVVLGSRDAIPRDAAGKKVFAIEVQRKNKLRDAITARGGKFNVDSSVEELKSNPVFQRGN